MIKHDKKYWKQYRKENREQIRENNRKYDSSKKAKERREIYNKNPEIIKKRRERQRQYCHRPEVKERRRDYMREYARNLRLKDPEKYRKYHNKWNQEHKKEVIGYVNKYLEKPGVKAKKRKYNKEYYHRPEVKDKRNRKALEKKCSNIKPPTIQERNESWNLLPKEEQAKVLERARKEIFEQIKQEETSDAKGNIQPLQD